MQVSFRRTIGGLAFLTGAALLPVTVSAQSGARLVSFAAGGGVTIPSGDLGDGADPGFNIFGLLQANPARQPFSIRGELQYHRMGLSSGVFDGTGADEDVGGHISILVIGGALALDLAPRTASLSPYVVAGAAHYDSKVSIDEQGIEVSTSQGKIGWNAGGGLRFRTRSASLFVEARYHATKFDDAKFNFIPISLGISF